MKVTIAIATYNRAAELKLTLRSLMQMNRVGPDQHEILVIGNRCTDHTRAVVEASAEESGGLIRYVEEGRQGLSWARNCAIAEARGEIIAFLDDDVNVDPNWLTALLDAYTRNDCAVVGGRASLVYPSLRPAWLSDKSEGLLTKVELGSDPRVASADELYGLNVSIRREWLDRVGGFRTDLGRVGTCLLGSEETELLERIQVAGGKLWYEPSAWVGHRVPQDRLRRRWFWARCYWGGFGATRLLDWTQVTAYALVRASWHLCVALGDAVRGFVLGGPRSPGFADATNRVAAKCGVWVGLLVQLRVNRRLNVAAATVCDIA